MPAIVIPWMDKTVVFQHLIGHRGEPVHWPENSLSGFREVLAAGALFIEADVQITLDRVAVLSHDESLLKITGRDLHVTETSSQTVRSLSAGYADRFGDRFIHERIPTLTEFCDLLCRSPDARAFIELKHASIRSCGVERAVDLMLASSSAATSQTIPISFEYQALKYLRDISRLPVGWVISEWNEASRRLADALEPEFLFVNRRIVPDPPAPPWPGPWRWAVYTANDIQDIARYLARGFDLVETDDIRRMARAC